MSAPPSSNRLSDDLRRILDAAGGKPLAVREILVHTHGRGLQTVAIIMCLPFLSPVSVPFLSIPFGATIAILGIRIAFRHGPWLPESVLAREISYPALSAMLGFGIKFHAKLERFLKVRMTALVDSPAATLGVGFCISLAAIILSLPIPPPFPLTNTIPGVAIILLCLGTLERDGLLVLVGYLLTAIGTVYVTLIGLLGKAGVDALWRWLFS